MKRYMFCSVALACCLLPVWAGAQDQPQPEKKVRADGPQQDEAQLIAVLQGSAAWAEKELACRALRRVGTAQSVPALAALLGDEKLSHHARYALEVMPFPEAGQALRAAVATTSGLQKVGVVTTLGARHDAEAAPVIGPLLQDSNPDIARAAAGALGRIATPEAVNALTGAYAGAPEATKMAVAEGLLAAGDRLSGEGKDKQAAAIYEGLLAPEAPESVRLGAFRGLAHTQPRQSMERVLEAMKGDDAKLRNFAAQLVAETTEGTRRYAGALGKLPPAGQVALLRGLANRKDTAAHHAVVKTLDSSETDVKLAAIHALGALGGSVDVATLTALLGAEDQAVAGAARAALAAMKTPEVNSAVFAAVSGAAPAVRVQLIGLLTDRMTPEAVAAGLQNIGDADLNVRIASLEALAQLGTAKEVEVVLASLKQTQDAKERSTATRALGSISAHHGEEVLPLLLASMQDANLEARLAMLRTLVQIRNPKALEAVVAALSDPEKQISDEAARVLSNWPTADAAPYLLQLAQNEDATRKDLGLRGYVRLARESGDVNQKIEMLNTAMGLAKEPKEKFVVLAAWGTVQDKRGLDVLVPFLDDPAVVNEAAAAILQAANDMGRENAELRPPALEAVKAVLAKSTNEAILDRANVVMGNLSK